MLQANEAPALRRQGKDNYSLEVAIRVGTKTLEYRSTRTSVPIQY
jgi:hypothetical protein